MQRLSQSEKHIRDLIETLTASAERTEVFVEVCERLEKAIGFNTAFLLPFDLANATIPPDGHILLNHSTAMSRLFAEHYAPLDPFYTTWVMNPANLNRAARNTDVVSVSTLRDSEFGQDFLPKVPALYVLGGLLSHSGKVVGGFAIHRTKSDRDFTEQDTHVIKGSLREILRYAQNDTSGWSRRTVYKYPAS